MQLTLPHCSVKAMCLLNGFIPSLSPMLSKLTQTNSSYVFVRNTYISKFSRQLYCSKNSFSEQKKLRGYNSFNVKTLWEEEHEKESSNGIKTHVKLDSLPLKEKHIRQDDVFFKNLNELNKRKTVSNEDWEEFKMSILETPGSINDENIDAIVIKHSAELNLSLSKSYFNHLKSVRKKINRATYGNYLHAFYTWSDSCTNDDLKEIERIFNELLSIYPKLDSYTAEKVIAALCLTANWKQYDKLFKDIKQIYNPSISVYSVVIKTAFKHGDIDLGWKLIDEMMLNCGRVSDDVFIFWLSCNKTNNGLVRVLDFLSKWNVLPSSQLSQEILNCFNDLNTQAKGAVTTISTSGVCKHCKSAVEQAWVSTDDYDQLKSAFLDPVLIGKDIFLKTRPEEFSEFLIFLENTAPYDIVLDGLNIAMRVTKDKRTPKVQAYQLKSVVRHFTAQNKRILVIGRKHMSRWPAEEMNYVLNNAHVFLAEDMSQDDPFLLYATLYSGLGTCFVSRDLMRGHKFLLGNPKLKDTFQKWQAQHQYFVKYVSENGGVNLKDPVPFMQTIQKNALGEWHIPYEVKEERTNWSPIDNYHKHWLCLSHRPIPQRHTFSQKISEDKSFRRKDPRFRVLK